MCVFAYLCGGIFCAVVQVSLASFSSVMGEVPLFVT